MVNGLTNGDYDGITTILECSTETMDGLQSIGNALNPWRSETGDRRWDGVDGSMVTHFIHSIHLCNQSLSACVTREEDKTERGIPRKKSQVLLIFIGDRRRGFQGSDVGFGSKGGGCGGTVGDSFLSCASVPKTSAVKLSYYCYGIMFVTQS